LTPEAFNALLKTLEEPPKHVKFIFATTQAHKVPPTILSRCQRFDFRRIGSAQIVENLKKIVGAEALEINDEALGLIARYSDGGMRDAQVMLDQITSFAKGKVTAKDVTKILGMVEDEALFELSAAIRDNEAARALGTLDRLTSEGKDALQVAVGLIEHFRNIAICKIDTENNSLIDAGPDKIKRYREEAAAFTVEETLYIIYTLANAMDFIKKSNLAKVPLEAALVKLTLKRPAVSLTEILKRVEAIEKGYCRPETAASPVRMHAPEVKTAPSETKPKPSGGLPKSAALEEISGSWQAIINHITPTKISVASYLQEGYPASLEKNTLSIGFSKTMQFHKEVLESPDNRSLVEAAVKAVLGKELRVTFILVEPQALPRPRGAYQYEDGDDISQEGAVKKEVDPIVKAAMEIFGGDMANGPSGEGRPR
ncbi:MAG: hypothetical protein PHX20_07410, partial [Candidatus Omnitrophica bacterium]|nr:hypothetical protein [Candidatus Omnitrophota bacterium]